MIEPADERLDSALMRTEAVVAGYSEDVDILHGVDIEIRAGEIVTIIGPNGAGKSTLIKTLAGLLRARGGSIVFDGRDVTGMPPHRLVAQGLAYVPQLENTFPSMTVEENLELGAFSARPGTRARMEEVYARFPLLRERRSQRAGTMSGGQRQMLALGRALMSGPKLMMLDEPSAGLAPTVVDSLFSQIQEINHDGLSILLIEQNARRALAMSHRGYVLDLGRNRFEGSGQDLLHDPKVTELYLGGGRRLEEGDAAIGEG